MSQFWTKTFKTDIAMRRRAHAQIARWNYTRDHSRRRRVNGRLVSLKVRPR